MKTICKKCGHGNELGHLFCTKCSGRLDLLNIGDEIEQNVVSEKRKGFFVFVWVPAVLLLVACAGLVLWPCKSFFDKDAKPGRRDNVEAVLSRLHSVAERGSAPYAAPALKVEDLNTWLDDISAKLGVKSVSVSLKQGAFTLRVVSVYGPWVLLDGKVTVPPVASSFEISGKVVDGKLVVTGSKLGHLPLVGVLTRKTIDRLDGVFKDRKKEKLVVSRLSEVKFDDGTVSVTVLPPAR